MGPNALERLRGYVEGALKRSSGIVGDHDWGRQAGQVIVAGVHVAAEPVMVRQARGFPCSSTPDVFPGDQIGLEVPNAMEAFGTVGLIVSKLDGGQTKRFMLTNAHVVERKPLDPAVLQIYKPEKGSCNDPIGTTRYDPGFWLKSVGFSSPSLPGVAFEVDAALANINAKVKSGNINKDVVSKIPQFGPDVRNLFTELALGPVTSLAAAKTLNQAVAAKQIEVRKVGATTGFTRGLIVGVCTPVNNPSPTDPPFHFELVIAPHPSEPSKTQTYKTSKNDADEALGDFDPASNFILPTVTCKVGPGSGDDQTITTEGRIFANLGDSGSLIVDTAGKIVGLLQQTGGSWIKDTKANKNIRLPNGLGMAQFIVPAFEALGLGLNAAVPPGAPQAGPVSLEMESDEPPEMTERRMFEAAEKTFSHTRDGRRLLRLARRHLPEIRSLLHHRRRVTVAWHRNRGPAYVAAIARAVRHPGRPVPAEIDGEPIVNGLHEVRTVLRLEGSPALADSLDEHGDWLISLFDGAPSTDHALRRLTGDVDPKVGIEPTCLHVVNAKGVPGSVSALVRTQDGTLHLLTNHHVLLGGSAAIGDKIWAVSADDGHPGLIEIGTTTSGYIGRVMDYGLPVFVDYAVGKLLGPESLPASIWARLPVIADVADAAIGGLVTKQGVATGRTTGRIVDVAYPDLPLINGRQYDAPGQLLIKPVSAAGLPAGIDVNFCTPGDSGAVVFDEHHRAVGLLWGANANGEGIACPIRPVLEALAVAPIQGARRSPAMAEPT